MPNPPLVVAIDARALTERFTSNRTYWLELVRSLVSRQEEGRVGAAFRYDLYVEAPLPPGLLPPGPSWREIVVRARSSRLWSLVAFPRAARANGASLAHMQYTVSPLFRIPTVTTVHDVSYFIEPRWFSRKNALLLRASVPPSCRRAQRVLAVSETCREEIVRIVGVPAAKVVATPNGLSPRMAPQDPVASTAFMRERYDLAWPYALLVGGLQPRKNWPLAIRAVAAARPAMDLVVTGPMRDDPDAVATVVREVGGEGWVHLVGGIPDEDLPKAYGGARVLVHPSFHEGFGLTPLEAFGCGARVVASNRGAIPEVAAGIATLLAPKDPEPWAEALLAEGDSSLREAGFARAAQYTWDRTAALTEAAYLAALGAELHPG